MLVLALAGTIMQHVKEGCKITIDSLENFGGDLDA